VDNFKYIKNISNGVGVINLYSQIGDSIDAKGNYLSGISGTGFAYEMQYLSDNCESIEVHINSVGGSVIEGYSIISAILNCKKPVNTYVDGLAASIAGVIAVAGQKCYIMDYGTLMVHNPSGGNDQKVLDLVKETLVTILSNRCKKTPEQISSMMEKETWLSAKEAVTAGFCDEILSSGKKVTINNETTSLYDMALIYNKLITKKNPMSKTNQLLGLKNEAEENEQVHAIEVLKTSLAEAEAVNNELKAELQTIKDAEAAKEAKAKEVLNNKATELVNTAVKEGKLKQTEVESTVKLASKDEDSFELVSNMIARLGNGKEAAKIFNAAVITNDPNSRNTWVYNDWEKKDPEGLTNMYKNDKAQYDELLKTYKK
jgi:ATP-dependent protease ClpP protease subunit